MIRKVGIIEHGGYLCLVGIDADRHRFTLLMKFKSWDGVGSLGEYLTSMYETANPLPECVNKYMKERYG